MGGKIRVLHVVSLDVIGGVESLFARYLSAVDDDRLEHHVLVVRRPVHPLIRRVVSEKAASVHLAKYVGPFKVPQRPRFLRSRRLAGIVRRVSPDLMLLYNSLGRIEFLAMAEAAECPAASVHYERGGAWGEHDVGAVSEFLPAMAGVLCISRAARRMLELRWGLAPDTAAVIYNGMRLDATRAGSSPRGLPSAGPIRLGFVGRLVPYKGPVLAVRALRRLEGRGREFELHVAGAGPERERMETLAHALGLGSSMRFHGVVTDIGSFYDGIHVLLCPSVREPLGCVCIEAGFCGCPVVATDVDGICETVVSGETGHCIRPELPSASYEDLGGGPAGMPQVVYDPATDALQPPRLASPDKLAEAVLNACETEKAYLQMSARAREVTAAKFDFDDYTARLNAKLIEFAHRH